MKPTFSTLADFAKFVAFNPDSYNFPVLDLSTFLNITDFSEYLFRYGSTVKHCYLADYKDFIELSTPFGILNIYAVKEVKKHSGVVLNSVDTWNCLGAEDPGQFFLKNTQYLVDWIKDTINGCPAAMTKSLFTQNFS